VGAPSKKTFGTNALSGIKGFLFEVSPPCGTKSLLFQAVENIGKLF
tara:strand:- start:2148 stop:2285 length:138 start_codon:yes stop_codon:yes gene_type:complete